MNPAPRPSRTAQRRWLPVLLVGMAAPLVLHYGVMAQHPLLVALWWPALALCVLGALLLRKLSWPLLLGFLACAALAIWIYGTGNLAAAVMPSVAMNVALTGYFGRTLRPGHEALITRIARIERRQSNLSFPEDMRRYTRMLTGIWCAFFVVNASVALLLAWVAPLATWSLYTNVLNVPLLALLFGGEYFYRRRRFPDHPHIAPWQLVLRIASSPREYLAEGA